MLQQRRQQLKKNQRRQYQNKHFALCRRKMVQYANQSSNIRQDHQKLKDLISEEQMQPLKMQIMSQLIDLFNKHRNQQNTYVIIGNYLLDHSQGCQHLYPYFFQWGQPESRHRILCNYSWLTMILIYKAVTSNKVTFRQNIPQFDEQLNITMDIVWYYRPPPINFHILLCYMTKQLALLLNFYQEQYFPMKSFAKFCGKLQKIVNLKNISQQLHYSIFLIINTFTNKLIDKNLKEQAEQIIKCLQMEVIIYLTDLNFYQHRNQFLNDLRIFMMYYPFQTLKILNQNVLKQLFYLLTQTNKFQINILKFMLETINHASIDQLSLLLNYNLQISCLVGLEYGLQNNNSEMIFTTLKCIQLLLKRLSDASENKMIQMILFTIDQLPNKLEFMLKQRYQSRIQQILSDLSDTYY